MADRRIIEAVNEPASRVENLSSKLVRDVFGDLRIRHVGSGLGRVTPIVTGEELMNTVRSEIHPWLVIRKAGMSGHSRMVD